MRALALVVLLASVLVAPAQAQAGPALSFTTNVVESVLLPTDGTNVPVRIEAMLVCDRRMPVEGSVRIEGKVQGAQGVQGTFRPAEVDLDCVTRQRADVDLEGILHAGPQARGEHSSLVRWELTATYGNSAGTGVTTTVAMSHATVPFRGAIETSDLEVRVHGDRQAFLLPLENTGNAPARIMFDQGRVHLDQPASYADGLPEVVDLGPQELPLVFEAPDGAWDTRAVELVLVPVGLKGNESGEPVPVTVVFENAHVLEANVPAFGGVLLMVLVALGLVAWRRQASKRDAD